MLYDSGLGFRFQGICKLNVFYEAPCFKLFVFCRVLWRNSVLGLQLNMPDDFTSDVAAFRGSVRGFPAGLLWILCRYDHFCCIDVFTVWEFISKTHPNKGRFHLVSWFQMIVYLSHALSVCLVWECNRRYLSRRSMFKSVSVSRGPELKESWIFKVNMKLQID